MALRILRCRRSGEGAGNWNGGILDFCDTISAGNHFICRSIGGFDQCLKAVLSGWMFVRLLVPFDRGGKNVLGR